MNKAMAITLTLAIVLALAYQWHELRLLRADCRTLAQQVADLQMQVKR